MTAMQRTRRRNATRHVATADALAFGWHPQLKLLARHDADGKWRWLGVHPDDEVLYDYQVAELVPDRIAG